MQRIILLVAATDLTAIPATAPAITFLRESIRFTISESRGDRICPRGPAEMKLLSFVMLTFCVAVCLSTSFHKYDDVFLDGNRGRWFSSFASRSARSWRVNFHSKGCAVDSQ